MNCSSIPRRMKFVILAAFLAAHNDKNTDNLKFNVDRSKKRRKSDVVKENNAGNQDNENINDPSNKNNPSNSNNSNNSTSLTFSIERLLSIYAQVLLMSDHSSACTSSTSNQIDYGAPDLHSVIETLVLRRLLWKVNGYKLSKSVYGSAVNKALAENIAQSLMFPLENVLADPEKYRFSW